MTDTFNSSDIGGDAGAVLDDVPIHLQPLADGSLALTTGDVSGCAEFNHAQGDNDYGFKGTCGLVSVEDVLNQFGKNVTENDVVDYAALRGLCCTTGSSEFCGGTTVDSQVRLLVDGGVPAHAERLGSLEELAEHIEGGRSVIIEVNAGMLWDDPNALGDLGANHAVVVTGVSRDAESGALLGFYINDSRGLEGDSGRSIDTSLSEQCWLYPGGVCCVTDVSRYDQALF